MSDSRLRYCFLEIKGQLKGSVGVYYLLERLKKKGVPVDYLVALPFQRYDVYFISVKYLSDYCQIANALRGLDRSSPLPIIIGGGHGLSLNPEPVADLFDVICIGEGETWICKAVDILEKHAGKSRSKVYDAFLELPGSYLPQIYKPKYDKHQRLIKKPDFFVDRQYENEDVISESPVYFNKSNTANHSDTWLIELSRGCKGKCAYCELGWTGYWRTANEKCLKQKIKQIKGKKTKKVHFFSADNANYPNYNHLMENLAENDMQELYSSVRLDVLKKNPIKTNRIHVWRFGVDGMSERIRRYVFKPLSNDEILNFIRETHPHTMYKFFFVFGFPFEEKRDVMEFQSFIYRIMRAKYDRRVNIRLKFTAFIPQPHTPLQYCEMKPIRYKRFLLDILKKFEQMPGTSNQRILLDGITGQMRQTIEIILTRGNRNLLSYLQKSRDELDFFQNLKMDRYNWQETMSYSEDKEYWSYIRTANSHLLKSAWQKVQHMVNKF